MMTCDSEFLFGILEQALSGKDSHAATRAIIDGLDWRAAGARPEGVPHSVFQLANHMRFWMEWAVRWLGGKNPRVPKHASGGWPGKAAPRNHKEWEEAACSFGNVLGELERRCREGDLFARRGKRTRLEMLHLIASHNSYHAGQIAFLRQLLKMWPPPAGGITW